MSERAATAFLTAFCLIIFALAPAWGWLIERPAPPPGYALDWDDFADKLEAQEEAFSTGRESAKGAPILRAEPGALYMTAERFVFSPAFELQEGGRYQLHVTSRDILHGLTFPMAEAELLLPPGAVRVIDFVAGDAGSYALRCNETCGLDHNRMTEWAQVLTLEAFQNEREIDISHLDKSE